MALFLALTLVATACTSSKHNSTTNATGGTGGSKSGPKPKLRIGASLWWQSPNPAIQGYPGVTVQYDSLVYEPLIHMNPDGTFAPALATSWKYVTSGAGPNEAFQLTLRPKARFSDGTPLNAAAAVGWLKYMVSAKGPNSAFLGPAPKFTAVDDSTVLINLTEPNPDLPFYLSEVGGGWGKVASPAAVANPNLFATGTYGAGPYRIDYSKSVTNDHYTYLANPNYYDPTAVRWSEIDVKISKDSSSSIQAMQAGQLDASFGNSATVSAAKSAGFTVKAAPAQVMMMPLWDRTGQITPALGNQKVRQALNYAVNRPLLAKSLLGDYGQATSALEPTGAGSDPNVASYYTYDPAKAKSLLADAGYPNGFTMNLLSFSTFDTSVRAIAAQLQAVGVTVKITSESDPQAWFTASMSKKYDSYITQDLIGPMPTYWTSYFSPAGTFNPFKIDDPTISKLYAQGAASDPQQYWSQITDYVAQQGYILPIATASAFVYSKGSVAGVNPTQQRQGLSFVAEWYPSGS
jgi:peptide/nickel transport system substrate-binding protein